MGSVISSCLEYFPNWKDFILPTPETYAVLINGFQYFPIVSFFPPSSSMVFSMANRAALNSSQWPNGSSPTTRLAKPR